MSAFRGTAEVTLASGESVVIDPERYLQRSGSRVNVLVSSWTYSTIGTRRQLQCNPRAIVDDINIKTAVDDFWIARARGKFFPQAYFDRLTLDDAYRIQLALIDRRVAAGERHIGWKVGLTAKAIQEQFGFHEPVLLASLKPDRLAHAFGATELINSGSETELCVRLGRELAGNISLEQARTAVDAPTSHFEIIETRGDMKQIALGMADNGQQRSVVIGAPVQVAPTMELDQVEARVELNGKEVAIGSGSAVLGHPLNSIKWLAEKLGQYGRRLRPNDIIMTGSFCASSPCRRGILLLPISLALAEWR